MIYKPLTFVIHPGAFVLTCPMIQSQELWGPILNQLLMHTWKFVIYRAENSLVYEIFTG